MRLIWLLLIALVVSGCERQQHLVEQTLLEFGTLIRITLITDDLTHAQQLLADIENQLRRQRAQWHAWEDSDLTRFNLALQQETRVEVPVSLRQLIRLSSDYHEASGGRFNPALGKLIGAYGFHGSEADPGLVAEVRRAIPTMRDLTVVDNTASSSNRHLQLDFGGIAKGYAIGLVADYLERRGIEHFIINAGGDMVVAGNRFGRPWRIGIQNPFAPGVVASLELEGRHSLFTSGNYERQYRRGETRNHHIIDPRSGASSSGQSSVTVLSRDPVRADAAATALMIDGLRSAPQLARALKIEDYLLIAETREILLSRGFAGKVEISVPWPLEIID